MSRGLAPAVVLAALAVSGELAWRVALFGPDALLHPLRFSADGLGTGAGMFPVEPSAEAGVYLRPGIVDTFRGRPFTTNAIGFRERDVASSRTPGTTRIAVLGRSITLGAGVADDEVYTRRLEARLQGRTPADVEVLNFGVLGATIERLAGNYDRYVARFAPDIVLLPLFPDDVAGAAPAGRDVGPGNRLPRNQVGRSPLERRLFLARAVRKAGEAIHFALPASPWRLAMEVDVAPGVHVGEVQRLLSDLADRIRRDGGVLAVPILLRPRYRALRGGDDELIAALAAALEPHGARVLPTHRFLEGRIGRWDVVFFGDDHPSAAVHELYAEALAPEVLELVLSEARPARPVAPRPRARAGVR